MNSDGDVSLETSYKNQHIDQEKKVDVILQHHIPVKDSLNWLQAFTSYIPKGQHFLHVRYTTGSTNIAPKTKTNCRNSCVSGQCPIPQNIRAIVFILLA